MGGKSSADEVLGEAYINFHTLQSGHNVDTGFESYLMLRRVKEAENKPFMNSEPRYEDHPACFNPKLAYCWDVVDVRMNLYRDILVPPTSGRGQDWAAVLEFGKNLEH